jgi:hypothetical protein
MKRIVALLTAALAVTGCGTLTGPEDADEAAQAARAKRSLEAAADPHAAPSLRLSAN